MSIRTKVRELQQENAGGYDSPASSGCLAAGIEGGRDLTYLIYKDLSSPLTEPGMKTAKLYLFDFLMLTATNHC